MLNEDVKFVVLGFGDVGVEAIDEPELIDAGATATLDGTAFAEFAIVACDNWAWFNISPPPIMNMVDWESPPSSLFDESSRV